MLMDLDMMGDFVTHVKSNMGHQVINALSPQTWHSHVAVSISAAILAIGKGGEQPRYLSC